MVFDQSKQRFVALFSQYTSISAERIEEYLGDEKHTIADIFRRPKHIVRNEKEMMAVDNLQELRDIYNALKTYDRGNALNRPDMVFSYFQAALLNVQFEDYSAVAFLDTKNRVIDVEIISGSFDRENIPDIIKGALKKMQGQLCFVIIILQEIQRRLQEITTLRNNYGGPAGS